MRLCKILSQAMFWIMYELIRELSIMKRLWINYGGLRIEIVYSQPRVLGNYLDKELSIMMIKAIWCKGPPFKYYFLTWRIWPGKVPMDALIYEWSYDIDANCG